jgi:hypothetical protein
LIVPPKYRILKCLPAEHFIDDLMKHLREPYYVGLLSAAEYHGATHRRPQVVQAMVSKARRRIMCGKVAVEFIYRKNLADVPVTERNTPAGTMAITMPEATAFDLAGLIRHFLKTQEQKSRAGPLRSAPGLRISR